MKYSYWAEYDSAAEWCAKRELAGKVGDPLPVGLSTGAKQLIDNDPEAFQDRVRSTAYALAMEKTASRFETTGN